MTGFIPAMPEYIDNDGYLYVCDRVKEMIVLGSENIYHAEIENVILSRPEIFDLSVIGVPHAR